MQLAKRNGWIHKRGRSAVGGAFTRQQVSTRLPEQDQAAGARRREKRAKPVTATTSLPVIKMAYAAKFPKPAPADEPSRLRSPTPGPEPRTASRAPPSALRRSASLTRQGLASGGLPALRAGAGAPSKDAESSPVSKRYSDRVCCAGTGVPSAPDAAFFEQKRKLWEKKIAFKYGGGKALEWEAKPGDEKHDPPPDVVIDYEKHWSQISSERASNKKRAIKNSRSSLVLGDETYKDPYWTSGHDLFSGRVGGGEIAEQRKRNAAKRKQLCGSTLVLGADSEYF